MVRYMNCLSQNPHFELVRISSLIHSNQLNQLLIGIKKNELHSMKVVAVLSDYMMFYISGSASSN